MERIHSREEAVRKQEQFYGQFLSISINPIYMMAGYSKTKAVTDKEVASQQLMCKRKECLVLRGLDSE